MYQLNRFVYCERVVMFVRFGYDMLIIMATIKNPKTLNYIIV